MFVGYNLILKKISIQIAMQTKERSVFTFCCCFLLFFSFFFFLRLVQFFHPGRYTWNKNWTFKEYRKKEHWNTGNNTTGNIWCFEWRTNTTFTIGRQDGFVNITRCRLSPLGASIGAKLTGWRHQNSTIAGFSLTTGNYFHEHFQWKLKLISNFSNCKGAWKKIHAFFCETFIYSCMK